MLSLDRTSMGGEHEAHLAGPEQTKKHAVKRRGAQSRTDVASMEPKVVIKGSRPWPSPLAGSARRKRELSASRTTLDSTIQSREVEAFEKALRQRIVGQDRAVWQLARVYRVYLAGLCAPHRPIANLLLLGPTGSGETGLVLVEEVAETLFGDSQAVLKIDCAEFQHSHDIAKLVGSPPGYLGHRETNP